jgi:hypothetical protein
VGNPLPGDLVPAFRESLDRVSVNVPALHRFLGDLRPDHVQALWKLHRLVCEAPLPEDEPLLTPENYWSSRTAALIDIEQLGHALDDLYEATLRSDAEDDAYAITAHPAGYITGARIPGLREREERRDDAKRETPTSPPLVPPRALLPNPSVVM